MRDILVLCPQERDLKAIRAAGLEDRYRVHFAGSDLDQLQDFDPEAFLDECEAIPADAVLGTKDQSALLAALLAERRGLPGPSPQALVACQHKPTARTIQQQVAPEATPQFAVINGRPPFEVPFFVKPVVGRLSQNVFRIEDPDDLQDLHEIDRYTTRYAEIAALAGADPAAAHGFMAEELLSGDEVTLEGYVHGGRVTTIGVTDSIKYPGTFSFESFEYPSALPRERLDELSDVSSRVLPALGFEGGFFNVEFFVPEDGPAQIIEVNGRIASQFAPLVQAVHGRSTYDALFRLALGEDPAWGPCEPDGVAVSYVLRVFEDALVAAVPDPDPAVELLVRPGLYLSEQGVNDSHSYRLAILYGVGETRDEAVARCRERARALNFRLAPAPVR
ncbi:MAG TPA: ATP-grasp domain-containing protein [Gaiellaceae bacterium]|jgi:biotin carboxylase|nr:ATP-grasp domain-containing protein [Gaiellaceae bacterium]